MACRAPPSGSLREQNAVVTNCSLRHEGALFMRKVLKSAEIGFCSPVRMIAVTAMLAALINCGGNDIDPTISAMDWRQLIDEAQIVSYDNLFRSNEEYVDQLVYYRKAEIIQVYEQGTLDKLSSGSDHQYLLRAVVGDNSWDDIVALRYDGERLIEGDVIRFVGKVNGLYKYEAVLGNQVIIPDITIIQSRRIP